MYVNCFCLFKSTIRVATFSLSVLFHLRLQCGPPLHPQSMYNNSHIAASAYHKAILENGFESMPPAPARRDPPALPQGNDGRRRQHYLSPRTLPMCRTTRSTIVLVHQIIQLVRLRVCASVIASRMCARTRSELNFSAEYPPLLPPPSS